MVFKRLKGFLSGSSDLDSVGTDYLEIDVNQEMKADRKIVVKIFILNDYEDVNRILTVIREGYVIGVIDISAIRKKDPLELKRAVSKLKKTVEALEGNINGYGNTLIVTPPFATVEKDGESHQVDDRLKNKFE